DLDGLAMREIAHELDEPVFTLYSRLQRGRRAFAKELRRLEATAGRALGSAAALLAAQRTSGPAPTVVRRRSLDRVRALIAGGLPPEPRPLAPSSGLRPYALAAALLAVAVTVFLVTRPRGRSAPAVRADARTGDPLARGLAG